ncbi:flavin monoamine oxidase family protein [Acanthopleuribacter pedis]|uniref:Tryptophan 2-monooxygenase n=1 Tax=Acanthopleuribacter pedis TaxID=442870 RepID=A0A8J7U539_9BACT|nr:FAD-dependent oxidoreductase [Acanthopleuribacter pedis]MBO1321302.1 FAD-dependent oxidoreductase [Acanthopleuribacter pedis]
MRQGKQGGITRRTFLEQVGRVGGAAALYETMTAMGLVNKPEAWAGPPKIPQKASRQSSVVILGAGIGGLTAAYELSRAGYVVRVLEAQDRYGGRSHTVRRGDTVIEETPQFGRTQQTCQFDEGLYLNMGPGRLPYHHRRVLHYCQELNVALEPYIMNTTANLFQTDQAFAGGAQVYRQVDYDTRGYIAEMLAKAVNRRALDDMLNEEDKANLLSLLKTFGNLGQPSNACNDLTYCGSNRTGCRFPLTVFNQEDCLGEPPLPLQSLLRSEFWLNSFYQPDDFPWQPTLFQPVGGMDKIVEGFVEQVGDLVTLSAPVTRIDIHDNHVNVYYRLNGSEMMTTADHCISNIPIPVLQHMNVNFTQEYRAAVNQGRFADTCKVGWQANTRFWENDTNQIYGGISWINHNMTQMWYPSNDYFTAKGTLTGTYNFSNRARTLAAQSLAERLQTARSGAVNLHPEFRDFGIVPEELGLSIAWKQVPYQRGGWAEWQPDSTADRDAYARLLAPDRRFFMVGDQVSSLPGWQEGAMMSAQHVVEQIAGVRPKTVPVVGSAPNSRALTQGS